MSSTGDHVNPLDLPEDEQVVYELGEWPIDLQAEAAEVLAESEIPHAWDGTDLVVHVDWEQTVDELLDAVERGATGEVDTSDDEILYELNEWSADDRLLLSDRLDEEGIAHHWDGYGEAHKSNGTEQNYVQPDKEGYITSGLLWTPGESVFYCNGKELLRWKNPRISSVQSYMVLTCVSGGWDNSPIDDALLPSEFVIDYVRVWQREDLKSQ